MLYMKGSDYNKNHPFLASIKERYSLCSADSQKNTCHLILDLKNSGITYQVGDSVGVWPVNHPQLVLQTLKALGADGSETIIDKNSTPCNLKDFFEKKANITEVSRKLIAELSHRQINPAKKAQLSHLLSEGCKEALKHYQATHEIWDALLENEEVIFTPQEFVTHLMPLLPRFYSVASSINAVGEEVHLTVGHLKYETNGVLRRGVCTHYLCDLAPLYEPVIPIYIQPHNGFTLPEEPNTPIIMIGPGTGVAPFRAFMQERMTQDTSFNNWLFFGERNQTHHFLYENYWKELESSGRLRLSLAFSRDQDHKIYVQHRMSEHGEELFEWLQKGAYLYVCGDALRMAKDVDATLHQIVQKHGLLDEHGAKHYVKQLRSQKRYLRDIY